MAKKTGEIYTPDYLVKAMLDFCSYTTGNINRKHVMDNSCGNGQFLVEVVDRYCQDFLTRSNDTALLKQELETYIHGIEYNAESASVCVARCQEVAAKYGVEALRIAVKHGDALVLGKSYYGMIDFVVGNPPYIRSHDFNEDVDLSSFEFCSGGMVDLYIAFYELSWKMMNDHGKVVYITPSSFYTSKAGTTLRKTFAENNLIRKICDLKHFQPFKNATTYTAILLLEKGKADLEYYSFDTKRLWYNFEYTLAVQNYYICGNFYFGTYEELVMMRSILQNERKADLDVKTCYQTSADSVYFRDFDFASDLIRPITKASTGEWKRMLYPYDKNGDIVSEEELASKHPRVYEYLLSHKEALSKRNMDSDCWYAYGRRQGIADTWRNKVAVNGLIKTLDDLRLREIPSGTGVYGGLYVIAEDESVFAKVKLVLNSDLFMAYVKMIATYKSGGYYQVTAKDIKRFLNYYLTI